MITNFKGFDTGFKFKNTTVFISVIQTWRYKAIYLLNVLIYRQHLLCWEPTRSLIKNRFIFLKVSDLFSICPEKLKFGGKTTNRYFWLWAWNFGLSLQFRFSSFGNDSSAKGKENVEWLEASSIKWSLRLYRWFQ